MSPPFFLVILQARNNSSRLPRKVLKKVNGISLLEMECKRILNSKKINELVIATTKNKEDDGIVKLANQLKINVFRGSENNVLERYYHAALKYSSTNHLVIIRLTGDCPLMDPMLIDEMIENYIEDPMDYLSNTMKPTYPDGLDIEVFTFESLKYAQENAVYPSHKEHVTLYIKENDRFKKRNYTSDTDFSQYRFTVDEAADFEFISQVIEKINDPTLSFSYLDVINLLTKYPDLININKDLIRDSGLIRSLKEEGRG